MLHFFAPYQKILGNIELFINKATGEFNYLIKFSLMLVISLIIWGLVMLIRRIFTEIQLFDCREILNIFLKNNTDEAIMIFTKDRKIYIGFLRNFDIDDNIPPEEKFLAITPIKSGYREEVTLKVVYAVSYRPNDLFTPEDEELLKSTSAGEEEHLEVRSLLYDSYFEKIENVLIPLCEIVSYRKYSSNLEELFKVEKI